MAVRIADGDSIAYWQTTNRDDFDGGPFIVRPPKTDWMHKVEPDAPTIVTLALPAPDTDK